METIDNDLDAELETRVYACYYGSTWTVVAPRRVQKLHKLNLVEQVIYSLLLLMDRLGLIHLLDNLLEALLNAYVHT